VRTMTVLAALSWTPGCRHPAVDDTDLPYCDTVEDPTAECRPCTGPLEDACSSGCPASPDEALIKCEGAEYHQDVPCGDIRAIGCGDGFTYYEYQFRGDEVVGVRTASDTNEFCDGTSYEILLGEADGDCR
jgi:hypothetical protein